MRYPAMPRSGPAPETLSIEAARAATETAVSDAFTAADRWRAEAYATCIDEHGKVVPDQQRRDAAGPAPRALVQITPGSGKTSVAKKILTQRTRLAVLVTPLAAEADGYANDIPRAIRRRPRTGDAPGEDHQCMMQAGYITVNGQNIPLKGVDSPLGGNVIRDTPDQEHRTSDICHSGNCPKAALNSCANPNSPLTPYEKEKTQEKLDDQYAEDVIDAIRDQPCHIYNEVPKALVTPITAVTALGFSDTDAQFKDDAGDLHKKDILCDESQMDALGHIRLLSAGDMTQAMEDLLSWKARTRLEIADFHGDRAVRQAKKSEKFAAYREKRLRELEDDLILADHWAPLFIDLRDDIEDLARNGGFSRPPLAHTAAHIREATENAKPHASSGWEKPVWQRLEKMIRLPLRQLQPIVQAIMEGSAVVTPDGLQVFYERPLLRHILDRSHPAMIMDGNPLPTIKAIFNHDRDSATAITQIVAEQHVEIMIDPRFTHGMPAPEQRSDAADRKEGQEIADTADRLAGDRPMLILTNKYRAEAVIAVRNGIPLQTLREEREKKDGSIPSSMREIAGAVGHWGRHNRATNDFIGHDIMIWDDPAFPREAQMDAWRLHRAILIRAGIRKPEEIPIGDFSETAYRERGFYRVGDADMQNPAREHGDPEIRAFLRELQFNEKWQGICRARAVGASPEAPIRVHLCGGMAMDQLHEQGIRDSQITFRRLVDKKSHRERCREQKAAAEGRIWAAAEAIRDAGGTITRDAINDHLRSAGETGVSNPVYRRVKSDPAWVERFIGQAARVGRGAAATKALEKLVHTAGIAGMPDLVENVAKEAVEIVDRCGGDTSRIIAYAHQIMKPGADNLQHNAADWLLVDTYAASPADRYPPAFPLPPPAAA